ncbi:unnamed protein product [Sphenostylis stenocarpa]|uniref:Uncharacterized protein n=1 Tax=Sphenostylis stenocarpa TaxID=92480 RepID=A0AA86STT7_9FABA|nr:unnamed protein product [Sphenostylis stenocarpa]
MSSDSNQIRMVVKNHKMKAKKEIEITSSFLGEQPFCQACDKLLCIISLDQMKRFRPNINSKVIQNILWITEETSWTQPMIERKKIVGASRAGICAWNMPSIA